MQAIEIVSVVAIITLIVVGVVITLVANYGAGILLTPLNLFFEIVGEIRDEREIKQLKKKYKKKRNFSFGSKTDSWDDFFLLQ